MDDTVDASKHDETFTDWYVFEAIVANGTWSIGVRQGTPDPTHVMVLAEGLTQAEAEREAYRFAEGKGLIDPDVGSSSSA